jgi:hypothetical protein
MTLWGVSMANEFSAKMLSDKISGAFLQHCHEEIGLSEYRHLATHYLHQIRKTFKVTPLFDEILGHSVGTAGDHYAISAADCRNISRDKMKGFKDIADHLHAFLDLLPTETFHTSPQQPCHEQTVEARADTPMMQHDAPVTCAPPALGMIHLFIAEDVLKELIDVASDVEIAPESAFWEFSVVALEAIQKLGFASFKSVQQSEAVALCIEGKHHFIAVLPTGHGKSLLFLATAKAVQMKIIVVVVPLEALVRNHLKACQEAGVIAEEYTASSFDDASQTKVVFVSAEVATSIPFNRGLESNKANVHAIIMDEIHLLTTSFRPIMSKFVVLTAHGLPLIGATATLPPRMRRQVSAICNVQFPIIRMPTPRPNIKYTVIDVDDNPCLAKQKQPINCQIMLLLRKFKKRQQDGICIVYCMTIQEVLQLRDFLGAGQIEASILTSNLNDNEKATELQMWESRSRFVLIATQKLGCGYNTPGVSLVIHRGAAYSLVAFHQESGRAGRNDEAASSIVVTSKAFIRTVTGSSIYSADTKFSIQEFVTWIEKRSQCRRVLLHLAVDGRALNCFSIPGASRCDVCSVRMPTTDHQPLSPKPIFQETREARRIVALEKKSFWEVVNQCHGQELCLVCYRRSDGITRATHTVNAIFVQSEWLKHHSR